MVDALLSVEAGDAIAGLRLLLTMVCEEFFLRSESNFHGGWWA